MSEVTLDEFQLDNLASELCSAGYTYELTFSNRANRDEVAKRAKRRGGRGIKLEKSSIRNQLLDPRYTVEGSHLPDKGLGNSKMWCNCYHLKRSY